MDHQHGQVSKNFKSQIDDEEEESMDLRRGPWTVEEDFTLMNYITQHGEGRWNSLARCAGLKRTGKSCRLRWLNYLRPDVRRGNITLEEQLLILELHSRWGNRWSKIAQHLPGRTDNEIKNYWRTRVQKHAKQLKCDVNSKQFKDTMRYLWMPRLVERIQAANANASGGGASSSTASFSTASTYKNLNTNNQESAMHLDMGSAQFMPSMNPGVVLQSTYTPENSSDSFGTPASDLTDCYNNYAAVNQQANVNQDYYPAPNQLSYGSYQSLTSPSGYLNQDLSYMEQWMMDGGDQASDNLWNVDEDLWFLQQQFNHNV